MQREFYRMWGSRLFYESAPRISHKWLALTMGENHVRGVDASGQTLLLGLVAVLAYTVLDGSTEGDLLYLAIGTLSVAVMAAGVLRHRPENFLPWALLVASQTAWVLGDWATGWGPSQSVLIDSPADLFYGCAYPLLVIGVWLLARPRKGSVDRGSLIDSAIATTGVAMVSWTFVAVPLLSGSRTTVGQISGILYPLGDLFVVAVLGYLVAGRGGRTTSFWLVVAAIIPTTVGDSIFTASNALTGLEPAANTLWLVAYVMWAAAAQHPSMAHVVDRARPPRPDLSVLRVACLVAAVLLAPTLLALQQVWGTIGSTEVWAFVVGTIVLDGLVFGRMCLAVAQARSAGRERDRLLDDVDYLAAHDSLTGLANRARLLALAESTTDRARAGGGALGVLVVDLDQFKSLNDAVGSHVADEVLRQIAHRIRAQTRDGDTVGRLGGDEFAVVVAGVPSEAQLRAVCGRILDAVADPINTTNGPLVVTACVGYTYDPSGSATPQELLHEADLALRRAKEAGRGRVEVFGSELRAETARRADLEEALHAGLDRDELVLHYQPVVDLNRGVTTGYEALVRWNRPAHGLLAPGHFIEVAEESDLICRVDRWVLREATRQVALWNTHRSEGSRLSVAVNMSGRHLHTGSVASDVADALRASGAEPQDLVIEITETVLVDVPTAIQHLRELRAMGVTISIDDFGTGFTSINQLQHLPVHTLKIDRSFVAATGAGAQELLALIINAAHGCGLTVVAEGIETQEQLETLDRLGSDAVQGFLLGRPEPASAAAQRARALPDGGPRDPLLQ